MLHVLMLYLTTYGLKLHSFNLNVLFEASSAHRGFFTSDSTTVSVVNTQQTNDHKQELMRLYLQRFSFVLITWRCSHAKFKTVFVCFAEDDFSAAGINSWHCSNSFTACFRNIYIYISTATSSRRYFNHRMWKNSQYIKYI